jgi:WXXGXW repeat (2 copies)
MLSKSWRLCLIPVVLLMLAPALSNAQVSVSVNIAPPELPVYDQPPIPGDGYLWTPGYWAWGDDIQDYYWVPGTWVEAPQPDYLWTPGYWGADGAVFLWHAGYWGPQVGFYGGVDYGYGYGGRGYEGGYWRDGHLFYNRAVVNVGSVHITNVYNKTVVNNINVTRVSFNGGNGGVRAQATSAEMAAARDRHIEATSAQREHAQTARSNPELRAATNHGRPPIGATPRAGNFANPTPARNAGSDGHSEAPRTGAPRNEAPRVNQAPHTNTEVPRANEAPRANETPREAPRPRVTSPRPNQQVERDAAPAHEARPTTPNAQSAPQPHVAQPQPHVAQPQPHVAQPQPRPAAPAAPVEPRREPEHTEAVRPAPKPQARPAPRPTQQPAEHPAEHPQEHEHH